MLRGSLVNWLKIHRRLISNEYKSVMEKGLYPSYSVINQLQELGSESKPSAVAVDLFALSLTSNEDRRAQLSEQLLKLRRGAGATLMSKSQESTSFAVIKHFVDRGAEDLIPILLDRAKFGVFLDNFTGCYLINHFLDSRDYYDAACTATVLTADYEENDLVIALSIKSYYLFLKENGLKIIEDSTTPLSDQKTQIKVRVKFIRNHINNKFNLRKQIGESILKLSDKCPKDIKINMSAVGLVLNNDNDTLTKLLSSESNVFYKDVLELLENGKKDKQIDDLLKNTVIKSFESRLNEFVEEVTREQEPILIKNQVLKFDTWKKVRSEMLQNELNNRSKLKCINSTQNKITDLELKKEKLWFFENEDKIDLQVFSKQIYYPKKWFGKKKKPKIIDDGYIPPDIH